MNFSVKLINLNWSQDRLKSAAAELGAAGLPFHRVSAVDGTAANYIAPKLYDPKSAKKIMGRKLSAGEIACVQSHLKCLAEFVTQSEDLLLVFEDDFTFEQDGAEAVKSCLGHLGSAQLVDKKLVVTLARKHKRIHREFAKFSDGRAQRHLKRSYYMPTCTAGTIWTRPAAEGFLADLKAIDCPIDIKIQLWAGENGCGLAFDRPPIRADKFASDTEVCEAAAIRKHRTRSVRRRNKAMLLKLYVLAIRALLLEFLSASFSR